MLLEEVVPCLHRELGYHHGGVAGVTAFQNLEQVPAFVQVQLHQIKVVNHQQVKGHQICQGLPVAVHGLGPVQLVNELACLAVFHGLELTQGADGQGIGQIALAGAGLTRDHQIPALLHQQLGLTGTHMADAVAAVVGLLLVLVGEQDGIDHFCSIGAKACGPAAVAFAVFLVHIPVEPMLLGHMLRLGDVLGKGGIGPSVGANQLVIAVTDSDLSHGCFQKSGLGIHGAGNGIVMLVKEQMVVVRNLPEVTVLAGREMSAAQGAHLRSVIGLECLTPGEALTLDFALIEIVHDPPDVPVQLFQRVIDPLLQFLQQMGLQLLNALFHGGFTLGLSGGRRQDHHIVELL